MADNTVLNPGALGDTIATKDVAGVKHELVVAEYSDGLGGVTEVSEATPLPVKDLLSQAALVSIAAEDFATQTTLVAILAKIISAPSTEAKQDAIITLLTTIASITQPLTDAQLRAVPVPISGTVTANTGLTQPLTDTQLRATPVPVSGTITVDTSLLATQATLAAILAKIIAAPSTEAKQDAANTLLTTISNKDFATQTTLAAILAKIISAPSTEAKQDAIITLLTNIDTGIPTALGQTTMSASMPVTIASNQTPISVTFTGSPATDNSVLYSNTLSVTGAISGIDTTGYESIIFQLSGTFVGNLIVEGSNDNSIFGSLFVLNLNEISMQDFINGIGNFQVKAATKYIRINVLQLLSGTITALILGRTATGINAVDRLSLAMDKSNNTPLYVSEVDAKKDPYKALIPSDAPAAFYFDTAAGLVSYPVDTTGYQSISIQTPTMSGNTAFEQSNDLKTWFTCSGVGVQGTTVAGFVNNFANVGAGIFLFPAMGRWFRFNNTSGSARYQHIGYLRQQTLTGMVGANISSIAGVAVVNLAGYMPIGGSTAVGTTPSSTNPVGVSGVDTSGLTRRFYVDTTGRMVLAGTDNTNTTRPIGVIPPAANLNNIASLGVSDVSQFEGQSLIEIMSKILLEMQINNQYLFELPLTLQRLLNDTSKNVGGFGNEPQEFRNESTMFVT